MSNINKFKNKYKFLHKGKWASQWSDNMQLKTAWVSKMLCVTASHFPARTTSLSFACKSTLKGKHKNPAMTKGPDSSNSSLPPKIVISINPLSAL